MKKFSTQCMDQKTEKKRKEEKGFELTTPRKQTMDFLSQFARIYHAEPLTSGCAGMVIN